MLMRTKVTNCDLDHADDFPSVLQIETSPVYFCTLGKSLERPTAQTLKKNLACKAFEAFNGILKLSVAAGRFQWLLEVFIGHLW